MKDDGTVQFYTLDKRPNYSLVHSAPILLNHCPSLLNELAGSEEEGEGEREVEGVAGAATTESGRRRCARTPIVQGESAVQRYHLLHIGGHLRLGRRQLQAHETE